MIEIKDEKWLKEKIRLIYLANVELKKVKEKYNIIQDDYDVGIPRRLFMEIIEKRITLYNRLAQLIKEIGIEEEEG